MESIQDGCSINPQHASLISTLTSHFVADLNGKLLGSLKSNRVTR